MNLIYKIWTTIVYDIPNFILNVWKYRKPLYFDRDFEEYGKLYFLEIGIENMIEYFEKSGFEVLISNEKKIIKMRRATEILKNIRESAYIEMAEKELGSIPNFNLNSEYSHLESLHISNIVKKSIELEEKEWDELMLIFKGQVYSSFDPNKDFYEQFDGSGLRNWWN